MSVFFDRAVGKVSIHGSQGPVSSVKLSYQVLPQVRYNVIVRELSTTGNANTDVFLSLLDVSGQRIVAPFYNSQSQIEAKNVNKSVQDNKFNFAEGIENDFRPGLTCNLGVVVDFPGNVKSIEPNLGTSVGSAVAELNERLLFRFTGGFADSSRSFGGIEFWTPPGSFFTDVEIVVFEEAPILNEFVQTQRL